jgi:hypothetical protein
VGARRLGSRVLEKAESFYFGYIELLLVTGLRYRGALLCSRRSTLHTLTNRARARSVPEQECGVRSLVASNIGVVRALAASTESFIYQPAAFLRQTLPIHLFV